MTPSPGEAERVIEILPAKRLASIDAYRGLVMLLMLAEMLHLGSVASSLPETIAEGWKQFWQLLAHHQTHVEWTGWTVHDMIQPSFSFLVGVALPFSLASRIAKGQSRFRMTLHAFSRAAILILLGVFLRSIHQNQTNWTFEDTLSQIGLGYVFLYFLGFRSVRFQVIALIVLLVGYWTLFATYPLPNENFDWAAAGVAQDWAHNAEGFAAHWNKNTNPAWAFDTWFLNLFPRQAPFAHNGGGYSTLNFLPTLGTMILGLFAGELLRSQHRERSRIALLLILGAACFFAGQALGEFGLCPVVKRIWTPSWTLLSGGICFWTLAAFYLIADLARCKLLFFPLIVVGANSITAYCLADTPINAFFRNNLQIHFGRDIFLAFGPAYQPLVLGVCVLLIDWLILWIMYRNKWFVRV